MQTYSIIQHLCLKPSKKSLSLKLIPIEGKTKTTQPRGQQKNYLVVRGVNGRKITI